jgi:hypothetical protein
MTVRRNAMRTQIALCLLVAALLLGFKDKDTSLLWSFERSDELQNIQVSHVRATRITQFSTDRLYALQLEFEPVERPLIEFLLATVRTDWRPFGALALDVINPSNDPIGFAIEVQDANGAITIARTRWDLKPHETGIFALPINSPPPVEMGMRGEPLIPGFRLLAEDHRSVDIAHITKFRLFLEKPAGPRTLVIDNIRLAPGVTYDRIVDQFGQFAFGKWNGKLKDAVEFGRQRNREEAELKAHPTPPGRDEYGGWAAGPKLEATGYFRTARRTGKWWLITPSGHLFFSLGMNAIGIHEGETVIEGREHMFQWLPAPENPLAAHYGASHEPAPVGFKIKFAQGTTFKFYTANIERKYGRDWRERWKSITLARLRAWGFNTIGNWSDPSLYAERRMPYAATLHVEGVIADIPSGSDHWSRMVDPFDPAFAEAADRAARTVAGCRGDSWCLGYFVDNELSWGRQDDERGRYGLAMGTLSLGATSPAKHAFVDQLRKRYANISALDNAWNSHFADWRQLLDQPFQADGNLSDAMRDDMHVFMLGLARRYFQTIRDALQKYDPNHLYLGSRFSWFTPEAVDTCAEFCDVMSFNIYEPNIDRARWQFLSDRGKPAIIGEFHMGAVDRGMFHPGLVATPDQSARAATFMNYVRSVVDNPVFVGCHYFRYNDEALTGRPGDGENYGIGFTTVVDGLYPEMVEAAKTVSAEMYQRRSR